MVLSDIGMDGKPRSSESRGDGMRCGFCGRTLDEVHASGALIAESVADSSVRVCTDCARKIVGARSHGAGMPGGVSWPCFEDGRLVRFGDIARVRDDIGAVTEIAFQDGSWRVTIAFEDSSHADHLHFTDDPTGGLSCVDDGERVMRPPVIGADGIPVEPGDVVRGGDGTLWEVSGIRHGSHHPVQAHEVVTGVRRDLKAEWVVHASDADAVATRDIEMEGE